MVAGPRGRRRLGTHYLGILTVQSKTEQLPHGGLATPLRNPPNGFACRVWLLPLNKPNDELLPGPAGPLLGKNRPPVLAENRPLACFPGAANPRWQANLRKNAPRGVHCPGPAGPLFGDNCPPDSCPGPHSPLRITIRGNIPPDHPLSKLMRDLYQ